jgi:hypothetical protein
VFLSTLVLAAVAGAPAFAPPGTYRYSASLNGQSIGTWTASVKSGDAGPEVDESSNATFAGMQMAATATLVLGPDLAPTRYSGSYQATGQTQTVTATLTATSAAITGGFGGASHSLALSPETRHFVVIEPALLAGLFVLPAQLQSWGDTSVTWVAPVTGQAQTISKNPEPPARPAGVPAQDAEISMQGQIPFTIWYDPATLVPDEVIVPSQNAVLTRQRP